MTALQDLYPEDFSHCYGCGRLNSHGHHVKSIWTDGEATARFTPEPYHLAMPGFVYGGLIASLIDCHAMATAAGAFMAAQGQVPGTDQTPRFVTGSLQVDYRKPTPAGQELVLVGKAVEIGERKVIVEVSFRAGEVETAQGRVVAVRIPPTMAKA
jgi:acyl-coenzyme A thioesterase PaaI-like protein